MHPEIEQFNSATSNVAVFDSGALRVGQTPHANPSLTGLGCGANTAPSP